MKTICHHEKESPEILLSTFQVHQDPVLGIPSDLFSMQCFVLELPLTFVIICLLYPHPVVQPTLQQIKYGNNNKMTEWLDT